jgi:hypothetical protein
MNGFVPSRLTSVRYSQIANERKVIIDLLKVYSKFTLYNAIQFYKILWGKKIAGIFSQHF